LSESSQDRTKRKFIKILTDHDWEWKFNVMFNSYKEGINSSEKIKSINRSLRKEYSSTAFVYRVVMKRLKRDKFPEEFEWLSSLGHVVMPYYCYHCSNKLVLSDIHKIFSKEFDSHFITQFYPTKGKIHVYCRAVKKEKPHNIKLVVGDSGKRYGVLNRNQLVPTKYVYPY
jgi:pyruvate formate-lyase activating enzyme-like uncharacterized protein